MLDRIKKFSRELIFLFLGGVLASYFEALRQILERGAINLGTGAADWFYSKVAEFEPYSPLFIYLIFVMLFPVIQTSIRFIVRYRLNTKASSDQLKPPVFSDRVFFISLTILTVMVSFQIFMYDNQAKINSRFEREIIAITPYASQQEINSIKSNWVRMKTQKEYLEIKKRIETYFKKAKLAPL